MCLGTVGDLVAHPGTEVESPPVAELGLELTGEAQQDVSLLAPVVRTISCRILDHANADRAELEDSKRLLRGLMRDARRSQRIPR